MIPTASCNIHCEITGEGLPLVLLHGIGSNSRSWRHQMAAFSKHFRVIAWDAPGFGRSTDPAPVAPSMRAYADCLRDVFDALNVTSAFVVGHSMGGLVAQEFYSHYPDRVRALVLADTTQGGRAEPDAVRQAKLGTRLHMIRTGTPAEVARWRAPQLLSENAAPEVVEEAISIMSEIRRTGYEFASAAIAESDVREVLTNVSVPVLLVFGENDRITPVWTQIPNGIPLEVIPNAGHLCYLEQPDKFNSIVLGFLNGK